MDWSASTWWWLLAGVLVAAELASCTFYLLMVALGCIAGALAAHAGLGSPHQLIAAALVGAGSTAGWHFKRLRQPAQAPSESNRNVILDIGSPVQVPAWEADGSARVTYRGAAWSVRFAGTGLPQPGEHVIVSLNGNELRVAPAPRH
jgi:membrane protein implicated in regulation of membrane protease activity